MNLDSGDPAELVGPVGPLPTDRGGSSAAKGRQVASPASPGRAGSAGASGDSVTSGYVAPGDGPDAGLTQQAAAANSPFLRKMLRRRRETAHPAQQSRPGPLVVVTMLSAVTVVASLAAAVWFGAGWVRAAYFTDGPRAAARDAALDAAQQAAINMTSMDTADVAGSLALARSSMTGAILESATEHQQQAEQMATEAGVRMRSQVLGASVTSLNSELDKASVLVVLRVDETEPDQPDKPGNAFRYTWALDMAKEGDTWKAEQVSSLGQPVPLSSGNTEARTPAPAPAAPPAAPAAPAVPPTTADAPPAAPAALPAAPSADTPSLTPRAVPAPPAAGDGSGTDAVSEGARPDAHAAVQLLSGATNPEGQPW